MYVRTYTYYVHQMSYCYLSFWQFDSPEKLKLLYEILEDEVHHCVCMYLIM